MKTGSTRLLAKLVEDRLEPGLGAETLAIMTMCCTDEMDQLSLIPSSRHKSSRVLLKKAIAIPIKPQAYWWLLILRRIGMDA